jgi:hypothetical protein
VAESAQTGTSDSLSYAVNNSSEKFANSANIKTFLYFTNI